MKIRQPQNTRVNGRTFFNFEGPYNSIRSFFKPDNIYEGNSIERIFINVDYRKIVQTNKRKIISGVAARTIIGRTNYIVS